MKHADLIARLEKLPGPDREVDTEICIALQYGGGNSEGAQNVRTEVDWDGDLLFEIGDEDCCNPIPELTASIDAAVALVERLLPGWEWGRDDAGYMQLYPPHSDECIERRGATPAIALVIALLRALQENDNG